VAVSLFFFPAVIISGCYFIIVPTIGPKAKLCPFLKPNLNQKTNRQPIQSQKAYEMIDLRIYLNSLNIKYILIFLSLNQIIATIATNAQIMITNSKEPVLGVLYRKLNQNRQNDIRL